MSLPTKTLTYILTNDAVLGSTDPASPQGAINRELEKLLQNDKSLETSLADGLDTKLDFAVAETDFLKRLEIDTLLFNATTLSVNERAAIENRLSETEVLIEAEKFGFATFAELDADKNYPAGTLRTVTNDPDPSKSRTYRKEGAVGEGQWVKSDLSLDARISVIEKTNVTKTIQALESYGQGVFTGTVDGRIPVLADDLGYLSAYFVAATGEFDFHPTEATVNRFSSDFKFVSDPTIDIPFAIVDNDGYYIPIEFKKSNALKKVKLSNVQVQRDNFAAPFEQNEFSNDTILFWFQDPRAVITTNGNLLICGASSTGKSQVTFYNPTTKVGTTSLEFSFTRADDHIPGSLLEKADGTWVAFATFHSDTDSFFSFTSKVAEPTQQSDWNAEVETQVGAPASYSHGARLTAEPNKLYHFFRATGFDPSWADSADGGDSWNSRGRLFKADDHRGVGVSVRPYLKVHSNGVDKIHFFLSQGHPAMWYELFPVGLVHYYYDANTQSIHKSDGTVARTLAEVEAGNPIDMDDAAQLGGWVYQANPKEFSYFGTADDNIPHGQGWPWQIKEDADGNVAVLFSVSLTEEYRDSTPFNSKEDPDSRIYYYRAKLIDGKWQKEYIADAGNSLITSQTHYAGGLCFGKDTDEIFLSSSAAEPFALATEINGGVRETLPSREHQLYKVTVTPKGLRVLLMTNDDYGYMRPWYVSGANKEYLVAFTDDRTNGRRGYTDTFLEYLTAGVIFTLS